MSDDKKDYVTVVYNETDRPLTNYPARLTKYLVELFDIKLGQKLLDVGCGRGEFLCGFIQCGVEGYGVDRSRVAEKHCPEATLRTADLECEGIPYPDNYFDIVYSKSVIEHFYYPEKLIQEIHRVLKPGGLVITLCPSWEFNYRTYFEDYTHRTPFMRSSLRDIYLINGFQDISVKNMRQLPILWGRGKWLLFISELTRLLAPEFLKPYSKWIRFSKEIMLIGSAKKPTNS